MRTKLLMALLFAIALPANAQKTHGDQMDIARERRASRRDFLTHLPDSSSLKSPTASEMAGLEYPLEQFLHSEGGTVRVSYQLNDKGKVIETSIAQGSGNKVLDATAEKAVRQWQFDAKKKGYTQGPFVTSIKFVAIPAKAATSYDGVQFIPLLTYNDLLKKQGSKPDQNPELNSLRSIEEVAKYLKQTCNTLLWQAHENVVVYKEFNKIGQNVWSFFEAGGRFGPSVVRRTISNQSGNLLVTTAYICEAGQDSCKLFREYLDAGFSSSEYLMPGEFQAPKNLVKCK